jgi:hypothetical protein
MAKVSQPLTTCPGGWSLNRIYFLAWPLELPGDGQNKVPELSLQGRLEVFAFF